MRQGWHARVDGPSPKHRVETRNRCRAYARHRGRVKREKWQYGSVSGYSHVKGTAFCFRAPYSDDINRVGGAMIDDMGIFRTTIGVAAWSDSAHRGDLDHVMVDTGSEYSWLPESLLVRLGVAPVRVDRFETADGRILERSVGFAMLSAGGGQRRRSWYSADRTTCRCSAHTDSRA